MGSKSLCRGVLDTECLGETFLHTVEHHLFKGAGVLFLEPERPIDSQFLFRNIKGKRQMEVGKFALDLLFEVNSRGIPPVHLPCFSR